MLMFDPSMQVVHERDTTRRTRRIRLRHWLQRKLLRVA